MTIKQLDSGRYAVTGSYCKTSFHVGVFDHLEQAEEAEHQLGHLEPVEQTFCGDIRLSIMLGLE